MTFLKWFLSDAAWVLSGNVPMSADQIEARPRPPDWVQGHTILLDLGWFSFLPDDLLRPSVDFGQPVFKVRAPEPTTAAASHASLDTDHRGISLRDLCEYELCVVFDCMPSELNMYIEHDTLRDLLAKGQDLVDWANAVLDYFAPARVVYPQGYVLSAAALRMVARQRGLDVVAIENTFRKDRVCWDNKTGITLASPIPMQMFKEHEGTPDTDYFDNYQNNVGLLKSGEHKTASSTQLPEIDARKILFIGQVNTDSSVLFHLSPGFTSQMDVVSCTADFVQKTTDTAILLKVHPKEVHGINPLGHRYSMARYEDFKAEYAGDESRVLTDDLASMDTLEAIAWADVCVTINSQAGLEAAAMGKPVILCGSAHYDKLRSVTRVQNHAELQAALSAMTLRLDPSEAQAFFEFYCEKYACAATVDAFLQLLCDQRQPKAPHPILKIGLWIRDLKRSLWHR